MIFVREESSKTLLFIFLISVVLLDVSLGQTPFKFGNIALLLSSSVFVGYHLLNFNGRFQVVRYGLPDIFYLCFAVLVCISAAWSYKSENAIFQSVMMVLIWLVCVNLSKNDNFIIIRSLLYIALFISLVSILLIPLFPSVVFQPSPSGSIPELRGIFHHQLRFGLFFGIIFGIICISSYNGDLKKIIESKSIRLLIFMLVVVSMLLSFARLYIFFTFLSLFLAFVISRYNARLLVFGMLFCCCLLIYFFIGDIVSFLESIGFDTTLTGRVRIWTITSEIASDSGFLGFGYSSFESDAFARYWGLYRPSHAHNSFLQIYFELGVLGVFILALMIFSHLKSVIFSGGKNQVSISLFLFFLTFLGSFTGMNYGGKPSVLMIVFLMFFYIEVNDNKKFYLRLKV